MDKIIVYFVNEDCKVMINKGDTVMKAAKLAGIFSDAPCGGRGTCGKCKIVVNGQEALACQTIAQYDLSVVLPQKEKIKTMVSGIGIQIEPDERDPYVIAFDVGTTTVVSYLLNGVSGKVLSQAGALNPQAAFGADIISRIQYVVDTGSTELFICLKKTLELLTEEVAMQANIKKEQITLAAVAGNTAMHHLLLEIDPTPLTVPPYMPGIFEALERPAKGLLPIAEQGIVRILPNIAGFVGGDTTACMLTVRFDQLKKLTLLIDIDTNGEMVLGDCHQRIACSTAAGPAFEGAKISCGMRGVQGAVDHVWNKNGEICWHVIGGGDAVGICGSGLLDLIAVLLENGTIRSDGRMVGQKEYHLGNTGVVLTQKDVREVQFAKSAIRTGIELLAETRGVRIEEIENVYFAGAFGNYLNPHSACRIGMLPSCLEDRIQGIGNAAGEGAKLCALSWKEFDDSKHLAENTEFLELASLPQFQSIYLKELTLGKG